MKTAVLLNRSCRDEYTQITECKHTRCNIGNQTDLTAVVFGRHGLDILRYLAILFSSSSFVIRVNLLHPNNPCSFIVYVITLFVIYIIFSLTIIFKFPSIFKVILCLDKITSS